MQHQPMNDAPAPGGSMATTSLISESDFVEVWGARVHESGDLFQHADVTDKPLDQVWTIVDTDEGHWIAMPGFHVVNKIGYCLTDKPWDDATPDAYWFEMDESLAEDGSEFDELGSISDVATPKTPE